MDPVLITLLVTSIVQLIVTLRGSRCTQIDSDCCCCALHLIRKVREDEDDEGGDRGA